MQVYTRTTPCRKPLPENAPKQKAPPKKTFRLETILSRLKTYPFNTPKGPTTDAHGKYAGKTAAPYPVFKGTSKENPTTDWGKKGGQWVEPAKENPTSDWGKKGGQWVEAASSSAEPSWEYRRPVGYQESDWHEDGQTKGGGWSPSWTSKGWVDYRTDKGYYAW